MGSMEGLWGQWRVYRVNAGPMGVCGVNGESVWSMECLWGSMEGL